MLKFIRAYKVDGIEDDNYYDSILNKMEQKNHLFSWNGDEVVIFKEENTDDVLKYLGIKSYDFEDIGELLSLFYDGYDYVNIGGLKVYKHECVKELGNVIDDGIYDDRILSSDYCFIEIEKLIKEQAIKVYEEKIKQIKVDLESIQRGNFKWI